MSMRSKDVEKHQKAMNKLHNMDEVYDLIDLSHLLYRQIETPLSFADYLRTILVNHNTPKKEKEMK